MPKVIYLLATVVLGLIGVAGDFFLKIAGSGKKFMEVRWFVAGALIYLGSAFGWFYLMKNVKLYTLGVFYSVSLVIALALLDIFYFKDPVSPYEMVGLLMAVTSLILLGKFA